MGERKAVAVIPARGGSKRLPGKNLRPLGGRPLIAHTIEAVLASGCFETVYLSSDSEELLAVAEQFKGVVPHKRKSEFATDKATVLEAMLALQEEIPRHDIFSYLLPTCPFRSPEDIRSALSLLTEGDDSVITVTPYSEPPQLSIILEEDRAIPVFDNLTAGNTNSRYFRSYVRPNGALFASWWDRIRENRNFFRGRVKAHLMPRERSYDIDDELDFEFAELVYAKQQKS